MGAADAQVGAFAPLRAGEDAARIGGEKGRQQHAGQAEEEEHPLADGRVVPRDLERVRDVVDQVVLARGDPVDRPRDRLRLRERGAGIGIAAATARRARPAPRVGRLLITLPSLALAERNAGTIDALERRRG